jgi:RNA polymerase sigma-70 factor, ECF subfamily
MKIEETSELIGRAKDGDASAMGELYRLHCRRICNLCIRMTANQTEVEDLTQEIFLRAFRKVHTFRGQAAFSTWLYRLGVNVVLMRLRKKSYQEVSLDEFTRPNGEPVRRIDPADKADHAGSMVNRMFLRVALDQLPPGFKRVIVLHDLEGYAHYEIAELTGRSVGSSKSQLHKARRRLRKLLVEGPPQKQVPQGSGGEQMR